MADSALIFDTHEDIQELVNSGMPEPQAETVVRQRVRLLGVWVWYGKSKSLI